MGGEQVSVWSVYIDNLTEDEVLPLFTALELVGSTSPGMARADARYVQWASPGSDEKIVNRRRIGQYSAAVTPASSAASTHRRTSPSAWSVRQCGFSRGH